MWCDQAKWVWSRKIWFWVSWHFLLSFNLVKTPQRLDNWFQRYKQLKDWTNNMKQKKLSALFGCILKTVFANSDSCCLITSQIFLPWSHENNPYSTIFFSGGGGEWKHLMAHNWQNWKRVFLTCSCHEIYRDKANGLKNCKYTWKITIFVNTGNLGQFRENLIFCDITA